MSPDPTKRFSDRAESYVQGRPGYPIELIPLMTREIGFTPRALVADIGSGTGILTRLFLENGNIVHAVEPNLEMRREAERALGSNPNFRPAMGQAESTGLSDSSVDLVAAGQAAHWFDMPATHLEFARVLRPGGHVMLVWNRRRTCGSALSCDYEGLMVDWGIDYQGVSASWDLERSLEVLFGGEVRGHALLEYQQTLDRPGLRARVTSSSYMPGAQDPAHGAMLDDLNELFDRHQTGGMVALDYDTHVYWGRIQE